MLETNLRLALQLLEEQLADSNAAPSISMEQAIGQIFSELVAMAKSREEILAEQQLDLLINVASISIRGAASIAGDQLQGGC